jgi:hypothetical protein
MSHVYEEAKVAGLGTIFYCNDSAFDEASRAVLEKSEGLISLRDLAYARIENGKNSSLSENGSYVREGCLFVPKSKNRRIWLRESLVMQNPGSAVEAHKKNMEYLLSKGFNADAYLEQIDRDNYFVLSDTSPIPTRRFGEDERTVWAFQDMAEDYGDFLENEAGISVVRIWMSTDDDKYIDRQPRPFANQLWLRRLDYYSDIDGDLRLLYDNGRVRGVRREAAEGGAKKPKKNLYSRRDIVLGLHKAGVASGSALEKMIMKEFKR